MKRLILWIVAAGFCIGVFLAVVWIFLGIAPNGVTRTTLTNPQGSVDKGTKFGIPIGSARMDAMRTLVDRGYSRYESDYGLACARHQYSEDQYVDIVSTRLRPGGIICIISSDDRVAEIAWDFGFWDF